MNWPPISGAGCHLLELYRQRTIPYQTASYESRNIPSVASEPLTPIPGHESADGRFMPDPIVTQVAVRPTSIYVQAGSFTQYDNASRLSQTLNQVASTSIHETTVRGTRFLPGPGRSDRQCCRGRPYLEQGGEYGQWKCDYCRRLT